jgi:arsenite-transporting ATPase
MTPLGVALDSLASRRVILFGGKGGVGKTTISAMAALHYTQTRRVILFTTDPASNLGDLELSVPVEALDATALWSQFLQRNLESFLEIGDRGTYLDREELRRFFELSLPGADELMAWMRIGELAEANEDALIVVDTAPTGHTLRMLSSSEHFRQIGEALDAMQEKHRSLVRQLARRSVRDEMDAFIEDFSAQSQRRRELLTDPARAAFIAVMLSEPWVVEQTKRLVTEVEIDTPFVILNRAAPDCDCARCREQSQRDVEARKAFANVIDVQRFCKPIAFSPASTGEKVPQADEGAFVAAAEGQQRMIFFAGKGGVGKTTCSAAYALQLAAANPENRYVVISVDPAHSLRDVFADQQPPANLAVEIIDTREKWRRFRDTLGEEIERAVDSITPSGMSVAYDTDAVQKLIEVAPPGADELFAITRLSDLIADESIAEIIVDTAPTGHFLRLLDLPSTAGEWVREFMRILLRYRDLIPPGSLGEELVSASKSLKAIDEALHHDAKVMVVTRPERIVVAETKRLIAELARRGIPLGGVIANYVTPDNDCKCDRSMRRFEEAALAELPDVTRIERRDHPVTSLAELATLFPPSSRA